MVASHASHHLRNLAASSTEGQYKLFVTGKIDFLQGNSTYTVNPIHQKKIRGVWLDSVLALRLWQVHLLGTPCPWNHFMSSHQKSVHHTSPSKTSISTRFPILEISMVQQWQKGTYRLTQVPPQFPAFAHERCGKSGHWVIECYTTSDPGLVHSLQLLPVQMQLLFAGRSLKRADALMPLSDANLSQAAHVFKRIFNGRYQCLHCEIHVPFRYECFNHLELYSKSVTKVLQGTHNSWETLPLHIRPFPRGSRERSSVNALNCKSMPGLPCAHCILPLTNQTGKKTIHCRTRIDSSPYAHLSPSWQMENCPLMRRLTGRPDRMITVKKGQKKQTTKTINESTCERRSACYLVIMILMSLSIFHYDVCFHPCILQWCPQGRCSRWVSPHQRGQRWHLKAEGLHQNHDMFQRTNCTSCFESRSSKTETEGTELLPRQTCWSSGLSQGARL